MKTIFLIRHSAPFVEIENYLDYKNVPWEDYNRNMILSSEGEEKAKKLCNIKQLSNLDAVYSADSYRAIGTAKYIAEMNNMKVKLDSRINERILGIKTISELQDNFNIESFKNKNLKYDFGESLSEVDNRFESFISELLNSQNKNVALVIHGIIMMSYLQNHTIFEFEGQNMKISFKNKIVYDGQMKNPMIFKIVFDNNKIIDIENIKF